MAPDHLMLAGTAVNADTDMREVKPSGVDACERRALHLPWPRAPPASSLHAGLRKLPLHDPRHWGLAHRVGQGAAVTGHSQGRSRDTVAIGRGSTRCTRKKDTRQGAPMNWRLDGGAWGTCQGTERGWPSQGYSPSGDRRRRDMSGHRKEGTK